MTTVRSAVPSRAHRASFRRLLAGALATATLLTVGLTVVPLAPASAAGGITTAAELAGAFANGGLVTLGGTFAVSASDAPIAVPVGKPVTLDLNGYTLNIAGAENTAGIGVIEGASLIIKDGAGGGRLNSTGGQFGAGIGGSDRFLSGGVAVSVGDIEILGGTVTGTGGTYGAGIGGSTRESGGNVWVRGGTVTAVGGYFAAGIGGGFLGYGGGSVEITGGTVHASGGLYGAGIGGGNANGDTALADGANVKISNAVVTASGGTSGAAIGGGAWGDGGTVEIVSGNVTVSGSPVTPSVVVGAGYSGSDFGALSNAGSLTIPAGSTLAVPATATVQNSGTIRNSGAINVGGAISNTGSILGTGTIAFLENVTGNNYLVTFDDTKSTPATSIQQRVFAGSLAAAEISIPSLDSPIHHSAGWFTAASGGAKWDVANTINSDIILHAQWILNTHTVSFDTGGGSAVAPVTTNYGTAVAAPSVPTFAGHTFAGWFNGGSAWDFATPVTGNVTLVAQWTLDTHTISFDAQGGSAVAPVTTNYGATVAAPAVPTFAGHTFVGWFNGGTAWDFATPVTGDMTLDAQWTLDTHTVSFDAQGGSTIAPVTMNYGAAIAAPSVPTLAGHTFAGWFNGGTAWDFATAVTGDMTLDAQWTLDTHTVSFDAQGGSTIAPVTTNYGTVVAAPAVPTLAGHTFAGWFNGGTAWDFATPVTGNVTLVAQWTLDTHTISFDTHGGSTIAPETTDYGTAIQAPAAPTRTGYAFNGWFQDAELTASFDFNTSITADTLLYAGWTKNVVVPPVDNTVVPPAASPATGNTVASPSAMPGTGLASTGAAGLTGGLFAALALLLAGATLVLVRTRAKRG